MREGRHETAARIQAELLGRIEELLAPSSNAPAEQRIAACRLLGHLAGLKGSSTATSQVDLPKLILLLHQELSSRRETEVAEEAAVVLGRIVCSAGLLSAELIDTELSQSLSRMHGKARG